MLWQLHFFHGFSRNDFSLPRYVNVEFHGPPSLRTKLGQLNRFLQTEGIKFDQISYREDNIYLIGLRSFDQRSKPEIISFLKNQINLFLVFPEINSLENHYKTFILELKNKGPESIKSLNKRISRLNDTSNIKFVTIDSNADLSKEIKKLETFITSILHKEVKIPKLIEVTSYKVERFQMKDFSLKFLIFFLIFSSVFILLIELYFYDKSQINKSI